jgi:UDP-N-acetylglucosamine--N-acetylmuramyl-(pentapeptide) pyrophosphoryl-undecaprenol N-acetylglucosamine transferase
VPFIDDMAQAFAHADIIVCRAGASTVTEIAAVGAAAIFVPFPYAVDDHQSSNAHFLVDTGGGWLVPQRELTPEYLADLLRKTDRAELIRRAVCARSMARINAAAEIVTACEQLASKT